MKWKILTFLFLIFEVEFVMSSVCNNTHLNNLIGNTAKNVSGWNIYINYGQYEGDNINNKFWKNKCGKGHAWYGACGRGEDCGSGYGKNVGSIETYFDGIPTMIF